MVKEMGIKKHYHYPARDIICPYCGNINKFKAEEISRPCSFCRNGYFRDLKDGKR